MSNQQKIAIVYDWIDKWGGVERVLLQLHDIFPEADFYTSYYDKEKAPWANNLHIETSFLQTLPAFIRKSRIGSLLFYPLAFESFNLTEYDVVISITSSFAKGVITKPNTLHICYLLTPTRYLWGMTEEYIKSPLLKIIAAPFLAVLKEWDFVAAQRPDKIISISNAVAKRCEKYYRRESEVVYPGFDQKYWKEIRNTKYELPITNYFLIVSRLESYKKIDLAIRVFNDLKDKTLIIIGEGTQEDYLKSIAKDNIQFVKKVSDEELAAYYTNAEALIMPQEEDFGYTALEAQSCGCPVIAYAKGGALETVIDGETGIYFYEQTENSLIQALERFHTMSYNLKNNLKLDNHLKNFSQENFKESFIKLVTGNL